MNVIKPKAPRACGLNPRPGSWEPFTSDITKTSSSAQVVGQFAGDSNYGDWTIQHCFRISRRATAGEARG
jgi:hypothetical protein